MSSIYTPTKMNLAFEAASTFRAELASAVAAGVDASALSTAEIAAEAGTTEGEITRYTSASALSIEDATLVVNALDDTGFTAYRDAMHTAIDNQAPEGWTAPA